MAAFQRFTPFDMEEEQRGRYIMGSVRSLTSYPRYVSAAVDLATASGG